MTRQVAWIAAVALAASLLLDTNGGAAQETDAATDEAAAAAAKQAEDAAAAQRAQESAPAQTAPEAEQADSGAPAQNSAESQPAAEQSSAPPPAATQRQPRPPAANSSQVDVQAQADLNQQTNLQGGIQFGQPAGQGLTITHVEPNTIFFNSGIRQNDVIVSVDGRPIRSDIEFYQRVRPGVRVPVVVMRAGRKETVFIEAPQVAEVQQRPNAQPLQSSGQAYLGIAFEPQSRGAAIVHSVNPGSPGEQAGLQPGDAIIALNNQPVQSHHDAIAIVGSMRPGDRLTIAFERRLESQTEAILAGQAGEPVRTATHETRSVLVPANPPVEIERDLDARPDIYIDRDIDRLDRRLDRAERRAIRRGVR